MHLLIGRYECGKIYIGEKTIAHLCIRLGCLDFPFDVNKKIKIFQIIEKDVNPIHLNALPLNDVKFT